MPTITYRVGLGRKLYYTGTDQAKAVACYLHWLRFLAMEANADVYEPLAMYEYVGKTRRLVLHYVNLEPATAELDDCWEPA